jgi:hypothetical protein
MVLVAISAEFAGLLPTQKPGTVSKIPTLIDPPYRACGAALVVAATSEAELQETAIEAATKAVPKDRKRRCRNRFFITFSFVNARIASQTSP